jgi:glutamyl/glutaminyl-tRNA synthetase
MHVSAAASQAVQQVFQGHATVQLQRSAAKGTSLQGSSDWDFFVRLNDNIPTVTQAQRMAVHNQLQAQLAAAGISYRMQCGESRMRLFQGRDGQGPLPDCDVVFQRFKSDARVPPNSKAMASSHTAQQASARAGLQTAHMTMGQCTTQQQLPSCSSYTL